MRNLHEVKEEIEVDFGLEVLKISETEDNEIESV